MSEPYDPAETLPAAIVYTRYQYDALSRVSLESHSSGRSTTIGYQYVGGNMEITTTGKVFNAQGVALPDQIQVVKLNPLGEVIAKTDAKNTVDEITTVYDYYGDGLVSSVTVGDKPAVTFGYDAAGNRTDLRDPNVGHIQQRFNAWGQVRQRTNNAGQVTTYDYDLLGRQTAEHHQDGGVSAWIYDTYGDNATAGALMARSYTPPGAQTANFLEVFDYQSDGKAKGVTTTLTVAGFSPRNYRTDFTYDSLGRLDKTTQPNGLVIQNQYNGTGYLTGLYDVNGDVQLQTINTVDARGNTTRQTFGNGVVSDYGFNGLSGHIESIQSQSGGFTLQSNSYQWRSNGLLEKRQQNVNAAGQSEVRSDTFSYDNLNRLTNTLTKQGSWDMRQQRVDYDLYGNITEKISDVDADTHITGYQYGSSILESATSVGYNAVTDAIIDTVNYQINYNRNGAITEYLAQAGGDNRYVTWNDRELPTAITKGDSETDTTPKARDSFLYGPDLQRFYKKSEFTDENGTLLTEHTFYAQGMEETLPAAGAEYTLIRRQSISENVQYVETTEAGATQVVGGYEYLHLDHLGSVETVTDEAGVRLINFAYDPFGQRRKADWSRELSQAELDELAKTHNITRRRGFTGHEHLERTGIIHMNGRIYDPMIGRFLSPDPIVSNPYFSQSYNRYSYVWNNPMAYTDPSGYAGECYSGTCNEGNYVNFYVAGGTYISVGIFNPGAEVGGYTHTTPESPKVENSGEVESSSKWSRINTGSAVVLASNSRRCGRADRSGCNYGSKGVKGVIEPGQAGLSAAGVSFFIGFTPAGFYADGYTAYTGEDAFTGERIDGFWRYAGLIPGLSEARKVGKGVAPVHHICTNKNCISTARGGPWTPKFEAIFKKAGLDLDDAINKIAVPGHKGPHPKRIS